MPRVVRKGGVPTVELVTNGLAPFWDPMDKGLRDAARQFHVNAAWLGPVQAQVDEQNTLIDQAIDHHVNGLGVSAIDPDAVTPEINRAMARGIPTITFDSDAPKSRRLLYIGTDNLQSGEVAGDQMVRLLPRGGRVWGFVGNQSSENARLRIEGFRKAIAGHGIRLVKVLEDNKDQAEALENVQQVLRDNPGRVDGLLGLYSYNLPRIAGAVEAAGLRGRIKIVGFDAEPGTLEALDRGAVDATVVQRPYDFGFLSVAFLALVYHDGATQAIEEWNLQHPSTPIRDGMINTGVQVVTPATVKAFREQFKKMGIPSS